MAVLNIKRMPDALYRKLQARARLDRRSLSQEVIMLLEHLMREPKQHSVLELKGLGKEVWTGIDARQHVAREREAWD